MQLDNQLNNMETIEYINGVCYAKQATMPEWFDKQNPPYIAATCGGSLHNEWYAFESEEAGMAWFVDIYYDTQSLIDGYALINGELFDIDSVQYDNKTCEYIKSDTSMPASLQDLAWSASRF